MSILNNSSLDVDDKDKNKKLIQDSESLEDTQLSVQVSPEEIKPDVVSEQKADGMCMISLKWVYNKLSI